MSTRSPAGRVVLYAMLFASGAAGLVYQVVWHKYLAILLGAQARATAVVLGIFLGGIAVGYMVFGRWSRRTRWNLLTVYTLVELGLGFWAFLFPYLFQWTMSLTPFLYGMFGVNNLLTDVLISVGLIGFPTFLMGGTLPVLTQGMAIDVDEASRTHARIYGFNTVGACFGSLAAGFFLIPALGLGVSSTLGGLVNVLVAFLAYFLFAKSWTPEFSVSESEEGRHEDATLDRRTAMLFVIGFLSGFYVLSLENVLIRLMGLATGASNYNFTLVVSTFVFGLGIGSLLVRRISRYTEAHLFGCQLLVSFSLIVLYNTGDKWPYWVHLVRILFRDNVENFFVYQGALGILFTGLLLVPVGFCGLILPLCFHLVKDRRENLGFRVGQLYGINTVGSVLGALVGGYYLLHYFNLDQVFRICVGLSLVSAALSGYLYWTRNATSVPMRLGFSGALAALTLYLVLSPSYVKETYFQPFRQQRPTPASYRGWDEFVRFLSSSSRYLLYKDGPNSTIGIGVGTNEGREDSRTVFVNGKSDGNTRGDAYTMWLTGYVPGLLARKLDNVCVVGFGTGITIGAISQFTETRQVDVVEISKVLVEQAHHFDRYNGGVSTDAKVRFHQMDAFRFLEGTDQRFDVVISEPSNPWVAGVENLFSHEFYEITKRKLNPGGLYVQWLQAYSFNNELFEMVLGTLSRSFAHVSVFQMMDTDFALVASDQPFTEADIARSLRRYRGNSPVSQGMAALGLRRFESFLALEVVPQGISQVMARSAPMLHLDRPVLSNGAAKAHFAQLSADVDMMRRKVKEFYPASSHFLLSRYLGNEFPSQELLTDFRIGFCGTGPSRNGRLCRETLLMYRYLQPEGQLTAREQAYLNEVDSGLLSRFIRAPASRTQGKFDAGELNRVRSAFGFYTTHFSPIARLPIAPVLGAVERCLKEIPPGETLHGECLLQQASILEIVSPGSDQFRTVLDRYLNWFGTLPQNAAHYSHFKAANVILKKLRAEFPGNAGT